MKNRKPSFEIGMTAFDAVVEVVKSIPEISTVSFAIYTPAKHLKKILPDRILRHNPPKEIFTFKRQEVVKGLLDKLLTSLDTETELLAFVSTVKVRGTRQSFYIPMMDFQCEISEDNLEKIKIFLTKIGQKEGVILNSGKSYHYYGAGLLSEREWRAFLGYCLLLDGVDLHYIGHQLIDGCTILRVSKSRQQPQIPKVIAILEAGR